MKHSECSQWLLLWTSSQLSGGLNAAKALSQPLLLGTAVFREHPEGTVNSNDCLDLERSGRLTNADHRSIAIFCGAALWTVASLAFER